MKSDICLILEGTYPYVAGGVSTWIAQILRAMPQLTFSILYIGAKSSIPRTAKYTLPPNLVELKEVFIHDLPRVGRNGRRAVLTDEDWMQLDLCQYNLYHGRPLDVLAVAAIAHKFDSAQDLMNTLCTSQRSWDMIVKMYESESPAGTSFLNYFWTQRYTMLPILNLMRVKMPEARLYHSACTGYAGLLAALAHHESGAPMILTEHGIYTKERRIEIFNADWIQSTGRDAFLGVGQLESCFKSWWTNFFLSLSRTAYLASEHIIALFEANREMQEEDGAPSERTKIIPNGISVDRFLKIDPRKRTVDEPIHIGFIGRVTSIKDVKTLIRSLAMLKSRKIAFKMFILGPLDEEEEYATECIELTTRLNLDDEVRFAGRVDVMEYLGLLDVVVLTSVSEGQPFVILEAHCAGIPVVSTDVGSCSELLDGLTPEDRALGRSGLLTSVASAEETADALEYMARNPDETYAMGQVGRKRVLQYYDIRNVIHRYVELYQNHLYANTKYAVESSGI